MWYDDARARSEPRCVLWHDDATVVCAPTGEDPYTNAPCSEIVINRTGAAATFASSVAGNACDDPSSIAALTNVQLARTVQLTFEARPLARHKVAARARGAHR